MYVEGLLGLGIDRWRVWRGELRVLGWVRLEVEVDKARRPV